MKRKEERPLYWFEVKTKGDWFADICLVIAIILLFILIGMVTAKAATISIEGDCEVIQNDDNMTVIHCKSVVIDGYDAKLAELLEEPSTLKELLE
jgi:hypothetical protein